MITPVETIEAAGITFREDAPFVGYRTFRAVPYDDSLGVIINQGVYWYVLFPSDYRERFYSLKEAAECAARRRT